MAWPYIANIPGQSICSLQSWVCVKVPMHAALPFMAVLFLDCSPPPHVAEQKPKSPHSVHWQVAEKRDLWIQGCWTGCLVTPMRPLTVDCKHWCKVAKGMRATYQFPRCHSRNHSGPYHQTTSGSKCPGWCFHMLRPQLLCCLCEKCWWSRSHRTFWWSCLLRTRRCTGIHHCCPRVLN